MKDKKDKRVFYYKSLTDDVEDDGIKDKVIDEKYKYIHKNIFYRFFGGIYYWCIIRPSAFVYTKIKKVKIENKKALKIAKDGYFVYGNHTNNVLDAFCPSFVCGKKPYVIVNPRNLNVPPFKSSTTMLGALPLPTTMRATKNFLEAVKLRINQKHAIMIYPEAKIWPYYTGIRPFKKGAFKYPVMLKKPVFCTTTTYQKTKHGKCKIVVYVDGPFYADQSLPAKQQEEILEAQVQSAMTERAKNSNYQKYTYIQLEENK